MEQHLNPQIGPVITRNRRVLEEYGKYFGHRIYMVVRENVDMTYNKKKAEGQPVLAKPLLKFMAKPIEICRIELLAEDGSGEPCIVINSDPSLKFPIKKPDFREVDPMTVKQALDSEATIFFSDIEKLTKEINSLNMSEFRKASLLAEEFTKQATFLSSLNQQNTADMTEYLRQLRDIDSSEEEIVIKEKITIE